MSYELVIKQAIDYIEDHLDERLNVAHICQHIGFSQYHFHRIFKATVGMSMSEYIRVRRLASASAMLLHTNETIMDITLSHHFESQEAFTRAFKKYYELPPGRYRKLMANLLKKQEEQRMDIKGWLLSGAAPFCYEMGVDREVVHQGKASGYLKSKTVIEEGHFATMMQQFRAKNYMNQRIRLSGFIKTENVDVFASMWMRVDHANGDILQFDNMYDRPIQGSTNWNRYTIVLDVPENSELISFGIILSGQGQVWVDDLKFETVDDDVPSTNLEVTKTILDAPTNLNFEQLS